MTALSKREVALAAAGFLVLSLIACYPAGLTSAMFSSAGDSVQGYFPLMVRAFQPVEAHLTGPWDATTFTGLPESHHPVGHYYPPTILLYWLCPAGLAMSLSLVLHHALAGLGAFFLARCWGLSRTAGGLTGIVFSFGGFLVLHRCHVPMMHVAAWVPWILLALECYRRRGTLIWIVLAGTLMTLQALAGHLQMVVYSGVLWLSFLGYFVVVGPGSACGRWRFAAGVLGACVLGALGSLPQTLPMLEVSGWSGYGATDRFFFGDGCLKVRFLVGVLGRWIVGGSDGAPLPGGYSLGEFGLFYGMLPLCLAIFGLVAHRAIRRDSVPSRESPTPGMGFWTVVLVLNVLLMLGKGIELDVLLYHVPVYNLFHVSARHVCFVGLALAMLAGYGLDRISERDLAAGWLRRTALILAGIAITATVMIWTMKNWPDRPPWYYWGFFVPIVSELVSLGLIRLGAARYRWLVLALPVVAFLELQWSLGDVEIDPASPAPLTEATEWPEAIRWLHGHWDDVGPPRCLLASESWPLAGRDWSPPSAFGSAWCIASMNGYNQSLPRSLMDLLRLNNHGFSDLGEALAEERGLSAAGARYFVSRKAPPTIAPGMAAVVGRVCKAGSYLVEGSFTCPQPISGTVRAETSGRDGTQVLAQGAVRPEDFTAGKQPFLLFFSIDSDPLVDISVLPDSAPRSQKPMIRIWRMTDAFAPQARAMDPARLARLLKEKTSWPFPLRFQTADGVRIYENPHARPWVNLVRETRPATSDLDAARQLRHPGPPVSQVAYVVGQPPNSFEPGKVIFADYAPDHVILETVAPGQSFLVLSVTRCRGWSAMVDGKPVPIQSVDGPFMGVFVPQGYHQVEFRFRPILHVAGLTIAAACLSLAWLVVAAIFVCKARGRWRLGLVTPWPADADCRPKQAA